MKQGHIEINMTGPVAGVGKDDSITLNGVDITKAIRALAIPYVAAGDLMTVHLDVICHPGFRFQGAAWVGINDATAELLISLGWTPPDITIKRYDATLFVGKTPGKIAEDDAA